MITDTVFFYRSRRSSRSPLLLRAYDVLENDILGWILDEAYQYGLLGICYETRRLNVVHLYVQKA